MTIFRLACVLNTFSKIYEKTVKDFLIKFSPIIDACRKSFSTAVEYVFIGLLEDWRNKLDNNNAESVVLTDLSKAFECILHDLLETKFDAYGSSRVAVA